ncbi:proline-rich protein 36-like [Sitophilus oryzae]|uniref:Proline-rich protein 36-like n=1 Tax=Sitophilus oryzae TaxID=7048 RepID=A0A6J2X3Q0_SITOR|nr:proline-rich protein 36-like [Sitophilus oryzae]
MKTILITLALVGLGRSSKTDDRDKRATFPLTSSPSFENFESLKIPNRAPQLYSLEVDSFLPIPKGDLLAANKASIAPVLSNSIEKPVQEPQEPIPQQPAGTAIIPLLPPPAIPVNAAAANVPANNGAVFLGSGALGVINLGNGAFALGSGGIGYSNMRQQPRPNGMSPLYPPLPASPNLVPAATPSQPGAPPPANLAGQVPQINYQFQQQPVFNTNLIPKGQLDRNGYEPLDPRNAGFGSPSRRIRPLKTRMSYATPTVPQVQVEAVHPSQLPQSGFGDPIPRLPPQAITYY